MELEHIIIHSINKVQNERAEIRLSKDELVTKDEKTQSLVRDLYVFFQKTIKYGIFKDDEKTIFNNEFDSYINDKEASLYAFSTRVLLNLKERMDKRTLSKGGYIIFCQIVSKNEKYFVVFFVRDKTDKSFVYENENIYINEVIHVDIEKLAMACRINIDSYKNGNDRYLSFLSTTQENASNYFIEWIGAVSQAKDVDDSRIFRKIINNIDLPKDENGNDTMTRDELQKYIFTIYNSEKNHNVRLKAISETVWHDPDFIFNYVEKNNYMINDEFLGDEKEMRKLTKYSFSGDNIQLSFPSKYYGKEITLSKENPNVIIIKSEVLASKFRNEND